MENLKKEYRDLEQKVLRLLRDKINVSESYSKHITFTQCIKVNNFEYKVNNFEYVDELVILNDKLTFIDNEGMHHSVLNGNCNLEDLIDILNN